MPFRFVHTADIHLDSPLRSLALRDRELAELVGSATRRAFERTIELCLEEAVDALVIAGDLYDGEQTSMKTAGFLARQLGRLSAAGIAAYIIRGNHDAIARITRELVLPDSVHVFGATAGAVAVPRARGARPVVIHGISFAERNAPDSLLPRFMPPVAGAANIALMHTSLGGAVGHDLYAPCTVADLASAGFDYWALGHIHKRALHGDAPAIVMPGMPQGRDINEDGPKSVTLVHLGDDGGIAVEERPTSVAEFRRVTAPLDGVEDWREVVAGVRTALEAARAATASPVLIARLSVTGTTPLAWQLRRDADRLKEEAATQAAAIGDTFIEAASVLCTPPGSALRHGDAGPLGPAAAADPLTELAAIMRNDVVASDTFRHDVRALAAGLRAVLPAEVRGVLGDCASQDDLLEQLAAAGVDEVLARLRAEGAEDEAGS